MKNKEVIDKLNQGYAHGFVTDVDCDQFPPGLNESVIQALSQRKNEPDFMLKWRLQAFRHWQTMPMPSWAHLRIDPIDFQAISYYSAPR